MHLAEKEIDEHREGPENKVVQPPDQGRNVLLVFPHGAVGGRRFAGRRAPGERKCLQGAAYEESKGRHEALAVGK